MMHKRFFGTAKGKQKRVDVSPNRFFANENLQSIKNPKQLIHLHGMEFEYILQGQGFQNPLQQPKNSNLPFPLTLKKNVETFNQPKMMMHSPYFADQLLSPLIKIRKCSVEKESTIYVQQRKRAFSFADDRITSPSKKRSRPLNSVIFRNLYNNSENQTNL